VLKACRAKLVHKVQQDRKAYKVLPALQAHKVLKVYQLVYVVK
jgi:hypothetical protein